MSNDTNWNALREERQALVERFRALPFDDAWRELRAALEASPPGHPNDPVPTVYEGPTRSFLLPLPFELLRDFIQHRGAQAMDTIFAHAANPNPLVAGYCLHALFEAEDPRVDDAAARVAGRSEQIRAIYGSFGWEGTLAEYVEMMGEERNAMTEFDYDLFMRTVAEEPSVFEGRHLSFCLEDAGSITEWMQADYSAQTWPEVLRKVEARRHNVGVRCTGHRFFVRVT